MQGRTVVALRVSVPMAKMTSTAMDPYRTTDRHPSPRTPARDLVRVVRRREVFGTTEHVGEVGTVTAVVHGRLYFVSFGDAVGTFYGDELARVVVQ